MIAADQVVERVLTRTRQLAAIPAPSFGEQDRAAVVRTWWNERSTTVHIDDVGNVWARIRTGDGPAVVVAAHLDTVFGVDVEHGIVERDGRWWGPSVGDDTVAVAALDSLDDLLPPSVDAPVWLLATVGEEGTGNLLGIRHAVSAPPEPIDAVIAIEGNWLGRICTIGVGSARFRVEVAGPGGHAWEAADVQSAVHTVARMVAELDRTPRPAGGRTAINIGHISGGQAINVRAPSAAFEVDLRADSAAGLTALTHRFDEVIARERGDLDVTVHDLGFRPAGAIAADHPLVTAARSALGEIGIDAALTAASTDANAAHAAGLASIAVGITVGAGEHTLDEWIDPSLVGNGIQALAATVSGYLRDR